MTPRLCAHCRTNEEAFGWPLCHACQESALDRRYALGLFMNVPNPGTEQAWKEAEADFESRRARTEDAL